MVIEVKPSHSSKQYFPNEVTDEGMVIEVKSLHLRKQSSPNAVTTYFTPSLPLTFSGTTISPEYSSLVLAIREAVFVLVSNKYRSPSITSNLTSSAIALLAVMSIMTTKTIKLLKELWADRPLPTPPLRPSENLDFLLFITVLRAYKAL